MKTKIILIVFNFLLTTAPLLAQSLDVNRLKDILENVESVSNSNDTMKRLDGETINIIYSPSERWKLKINFCDTNVEMLIYENLFYVGEYRLDNGEYICFGDDKLVTIKFNINGYVANFGALMRDGKPIPSFKIAFKNSSFAMDFVRLFNAYSNNSIEQNGWWRQIVENEKYADKSSKQMFNVLRDDIRSTKITYGGQSDFKTSSFSIRYSHPNLIISFVNASKYPGYWDDDKIGYFTMSIPINNAIFQDPYKGMYDGELIIFSQDGISVSHKGHTITEEEINFYLTKKDSERIASEFRVLRRKIISENYRGSYPEIKQNTNQTNNKSKNISDKYVQ